MADTIDADELFEAEYKLQNCIRITTEVESFTTEVYTGKRWLKVSDYVQALLLQERQKGRDELKEAVAKHLEKIEEQEGGGMLDIYAITGAIEHDKDAAFARDRLVSERRAVSLIFSIAAELSRLSGEESHE